MAHVSEIANAAERISHEQMVERYRSAEMSSLKSTIEIQEMIAEQMLLMMKEIAPHLGTHVNTVA